MNRSRIETQAAEEWLQYLSLVREEPDGESCRDTALELTAAVAALCSGWIFPLAVSLRIEARNPEDYYFADRENPPPRPYWFLRLHEWDDRLSLSPDWVDPQERCVSAIGDVELQSFVKEALTQRLAVEPRELALPALTVNALAIVLPDGIALEPHYGRSPVSPILVDEGQHSLVLGPKLGIAGGMPARLRATNIHGTSRLGLELLWDFWTVHPAGRAQVQAAIERVLARGGGWQLEKDEPL